MTAPPWTSKEDETLRRLHSEGASLHSIAKSLGRSNAAVSRRAKVLEVSFDRSKTEAATHAAVADAKARQMVLEQDLLGDVEQVRLKLSEVQTMRDFQAFGQGLDATVRAYANFKRTIPDDGGAGEARGIVGKILFALEITILHEGDSPLLNPVGYANPATGKVEVAHTYGEAWNLHQEQIRSLALKGKAR
ncbi:hypothetical protein [Homoserinibacter sp. GY 40078]|uniref:hypothetical protein n=1 Tax=Homoserinibacter sp. GY 40078 TaxID=2603275 RepID=UPI0011C7A4C5|nr:hypothetical protein [Homoserinibacter sp. GY 40078]TXK18454.1 hypothetical protein FVQ89_00355 [Homoserinibacter sp. GY 40078]